MYTWQGKDMPLGLRADGQDDSTKKKKNRHGLKYSSPVEKKEAGLRLWAPKSGFQVCLVCETSSLVDAAAPILLFDLLLKSLEDEGISRRRD